MTSPVESECQALADKLVELGRRTWTTGALFGPDRVAGDSAWGYGSDETVGVGLVAEIGGELAQSIIVLLEADHRYGAAALLRQLVEVEYLAWWHANEAVEATAWLRASADDLQRMFRPAALRRASGGRFSSSEYQAHCEIGGHPHPKARAFLPGHSASYPAYLVWLDFAEHLTRLWDALIEAVGRLPFGGALVDEDVAGASAQLRTLLSQRAS